VVNDALAIAAECARTPGQTSVWHNDLGRFICERDPNFSGADKSRAAVSPSAISPEFKLVFLTAAGGTILFVVICVATTILAGKEMPPAWEKLVQSLLDLAKIGVGAIAGLLGGKAISRDRNSI
jgi:hypothetical protein